MKPVQEALAVNTFLIDLGVDTEALTSEEFFRLKRILLNTVDKVLENGAVKAEFKNIINENV